MAHEADRCTWIVPEGPGFSICFRRQPVVPTTLLLLHTTSPRWIWPQPSPCGSRSRGSKLISGPAAKGVDHGLAGIAENRRAQFEPSLRPCDLAGVEAL